MPRRLGNLWESVISKDNIRLAIALAATHHMDKASVRRTVANIDYYVDDLHNKFLNNEITHPVYNFLNIWDEKKARFRLLHICKFYPDTVVQWCCISALYSILTRPWYKYSCGGIRKRGALYAKEHIEYWIRNDYRNTKYGLDIDIRSFYPSIPHDKLKFCLARLIKDPKVLDLLNTIIDYYPLPDGNLLDVGLPIGNAISNFLGNCYLTPLDHYIKEVIRVPYYARYADNLVLFSGNKKKLHKAYKDIVKFLKPYGLEPNPNYQVYRIEYHDKKWCKSDHNNSKLLKGRYVNFAGYNIGRDITRIGKKTALRIIRCCNKLASGNYDLIWCTRFVSYLGWIRATNSFKFKEKYIDKKIDIRRVYDTLSQFNKQIELTKKEVLIYDQIQTFEFEYMPF